MNNQLFCNQNLIGLAALFSLTCASLPAALVEKDSSEFEVKNSAAEIFDGFGFVNDWFVNGGGVDGELDGSQVTMTVTENNGWIELDTGATAWELGVGNVVGWTIEVRARVANDPGNGFVIWAADGVERGILQVNTNSVQNFGAEVLETSDNTAGFHDFRMAFDADALLYYFWRDGELLNPDGSPAQAGTGNNRLIIGDCCSNLRTSSFDVEHIRYDTTGSYSPVVDASDTDGDGIPNVYENENGLNPDVDDAAGDLDDDGLSNLEEFEANLPANDPDADKDGLKDGVETGTGVWESSDATGTMPKDPDTDGDGLLDGVESNTGTFVSAENTGTSPLDADSDNDNANDSSEVANSTDPNDPNSFPGSGLPQRGKGGFESVSEADEIFDGLDLVGAWVNAGGLSDYQLDGSFLTMIGLENNGWIEHDNGTTPWESGVLDGGSWTVEVRARLGDVVDNSFVIWAADGTARSILVVGTDSVGLLDGRVIAESDNTDGFHNFRMAFNSVTGLYYFWRDGVLLNPGGEPAQAATGNNRLIIGDCCSTIFMDTVDIEYIAYETTGGFAPVSDLTDGDGDGMPNFYEEQNGLDLARNDAEEDKDEDGLTNLEEFEAGLPANNPDADNDGLLDGVEDGSGTWTNAGATGTLAKNADSDGDGIRDGAETNTGTFEDGDDTGSDPNKKDSDGDSFGDGEEIARGSDPTDAGSVPMPSVQPRDSALFEVTASGSEIFDGAELLGDWVNTGGVLDFTLNGNVLTLGTTDTNGWIEHDSGATPWELGVAGGGSWTAEIRVRISNDFGNGIVIWAENGAQRAVMLIDDISVSILNGELLDGNDNTDGFHTFRVAFDAIEGVYFFWRDGVALNDVGLPAQGATGNNRLIVGDCCTSVPMTTVDVEYVRYDTTGAWSPSGSPSAPPVITGVEVDRVLNKVLLTWSSKISAKYTIEKTGDLKEWEVLFDSVPSGGETTTLEFDAPGAAVGKFFYRVRRE